MDAPIESTRSSCDSHAKVSLAKPLAPEDLCAGEYVSVLREVYEVPSYVWCGCDLLGDPSELIRLTLIPTDAAVTLKIKAVCLPFVLVRFASGVEQSLDVRRYQFARLDKHFARAAWKASKPKQARRKQRKRNKR